MDKGSSSNPFNFQEGEILIFDKPLTWSSFDVVNKVRHLLRRNLDIKKIKVGHAGTLDPMATGLLIICTGKATKTINNLMGLDKEYTGTMILGAVTPSFDTETEVSQTFDTSHITKDMIEEAARKLTGEIEQIPPVFSAIKVNGTRAYRLARKDKAVKMEARLVTIHEFEVMSFRLPEIDFRVRCSKGTYIRSLVDDFGKLLNSGAYLKSLRRTKIDSYSVDEALTPDQFEIILKTLKQN